jgi:hypothetical protein
MAVIGNDYIDLIDIEKAKGADGKVTGALISMLAKQSPVLRTSYMGPTNKDTVHRHVIRTGRGTAAWGRLYKGIASSKGSTMQVEDTTGFLEARTQIDTRVLELDPANANQLKMIEASDKFEVITETFETAFFYADTADAPDEIKGLGARYNALSNSGPGAQIIDCGGTGSDNMSVWMVTWAPKACALIHPKAVSGGIQRIAKGEQRVLDDNGDPYYAEEDLYRMHGGVSVGDWRYVTRAANIDVSAFKSDPSSAYTWLRDMYYQHRGRITPMGRTVIYCRKEFLEGLDKLGVNAGGTDNYVRLKPMEVAGQEVESYRGMPLIETENLLATEARIT